MHANRHFDAQSILLSRKGHFVEQYINVLNINSNTCSFICLACKMCRVAKVFASRCTNVISLRLYWSNAIGMSTEITWKFGNRISDLKLILFHFKAEAIVSQGHCNKTYNLYELNISRDFDQ